jgi:hypothetical protein
LAISSRASRSCFSQASPAARAAANPAGGGERAFADAQRPGQPLDGRLHLGDLRVLALRVEVGDDVLAAGDVALEPRQVLLQVGRLVAAARDLHLQVEHRLLAVPVL